MMICPPIKKAGTRKGHLRRSAQHRSQKLNHANFISHVVPFLCDEEFKSSYFVFRFSVFVFFNLAPITNAEFPITHTAVFIGGSLLFGFFQFTSPFFFFFFSLLILPVSLVFSCFLQVISILFIYIHNASSI